jgi:hypothetical protein
MELDLGGILWLVAGLGLVAVLGIAMAYVVMMRYKRCDPSKTRPMIIREWLDPPRAGRLPMRNGRGGCHWPRRIQVRERSYGLCRFLRCAWIFAMLDLYPAVVMLRRNTSFWESKSTRTSRPVES